MFHFSRSVKGLETLALSSSQPSLTLLLPPPLSPLLLKSGPVKPLTRGEMGGVWFLREVCVWMSVSAFVLLSLCDSVCALFKPTVSKALHGSLCIIGDPLLSAHCL